MTTTTARTETSINNMVMQQIDDSNKLKEYVKGQTELLIRVAWQIVRVYEKGKKVMLFGNGGSAADAQHIAAELIGRFYRERDPLAAIALTTNSSCLTAIGNDYGYEDVFSRQLRALTQAGDLVLGISTSGNSLNVLRGFEAARDRGAITVALVGQQLKEPDLANYTISFPSNDTPRIQEAHITAGHIICYVVEEMLYRINKQKEL